MPEPNAQGDVLLQLALQAVVRRGGWRLVMNLPDRPQSGESFTRKVICSVGSSMLMIGNGSGLSGSAMVLPMSENSSPTTAVAAATRRPGLR